MVCIWSLNEWIGWGQLKVGVDWAWSVKVGVVTALLVYHEAKGNWVSINVHL